MSDKSERAWNDAQDEAMRQANEKHEAMRQANEKHKPLLQMGADGAVRLVDELTLRDHFAMAALPATLCWDDSLKGRIHSAYEVADAMLEERDK